MTSQSFLPLMDEGTGNLLGLVAITTTTFTGVETSFDLDGVARPLRKNIINPEFNAGTPFYMSALFSADQVRNFSYRNITGYIPMAAFYVSPRWRQPQGIVANDFLQDQSGVFFFLRTGLDVSNTTIAAPVAPTGTAGTVNWKLTTMFMGAPACTFTDVNWVTALSLDFHDIVPGSISIGTPTPNIIQNFVKAYVIQTPAIHGSTVVYNTLRFVKVTPTDPAPGNYVYPCVVTAANGQTLNIDLTLVVT